MAQGWVPKWLYFVKFEGMSEEELNAWITADLIERLMARLERGEAFFTATDDWQVQVYQEAGGHLEALQRELARWTKMAAREIKSIFEDTGIKALARDNVFTGLREAGMDDEYNKAARLLERQNTAYQDFCRENDLRPLMERIQTAKWSREDVRRSVMAAKGEKTVAKQVDSGIIEGDERNGGKRDVQFVGRIDRELYKCVSEDITTDEVIITDERVQHIIERRGKEFYETYSPAFADICKRKKDSNLRKKKKKR